MSLKVKINEDLNNALKAKDTVKIDTLRSIRAEILKMDKSGMNREMTPEEEIQLLAKQAKMRKESIELFAQAGRKDLVDKEQAQLDLINEYLPEQMSEKEADEQLKGKIDGKIIQDILKSKLS